MSDKEIIVDGVDVSGCRQYIPRYMEDYDIDTLDYCRYYFKLCKDVDVKYCYFKQFKRKEKECEELKEDRERWKSNFNGKVSAIEELLQQLDQLKAKEQTLGIIEEFVNRTCDACKEFTPDRQSDINCRYCNWKQILNIIKSTKN